MEEIELNRVACRWLVNVRARLAPESLGEPSLGEPSWKETMSDHERSRAEQ